MVEILGLDSEVRYAFRPSTTPLYPGDVAHVAFQASTFLWRNEFY